MWNSYVNTKKILREIYQIIPRIECNPIYKIVEDNMIVGIITGSNQFVKLNEIVPDTREDDIELLPGFDETKIDKMLINHDENRDIIRNKVIHFLNLENHFYIAYINSIKVFIHDKKNIKLKKDIENIITRLNTEEMEILYNELYSIIEKITLDNFEFNSFKDDELINLHEIELCNNKDEKKIYCLFENDKNKLILPIKNLYNGESNLVKYVSDLTHDLLFNNTFQSKVLKNLQTIVNENIPLRINENEILLIESMIKKYYSSIKRKSSKYISNKVFEEMVPSDILKLVEHKLLNMEDEPEEDVEEETEEEKEEEVKKLTPIIEEENVEKITRPRTSRRTRTENKVKTPSPEPQEEEQENKVKTPSPEPQEEEQENKAKTPSPEPQEEEQENVVKIPSPEPQEEQEQENKAKTPSPEPQEEEEEEEQEITPSPEPQEEEEEEEEQEITPSPEPQEEEEQENEVKTPSPEPQEEQEKTPISPPKHMEEIDKVLEEIDDPENIQQNEENELDNSKSSNVSEYKIKYNKQKGKSIN